jgi:hypothetical protein
VEFAAARCEAAAHAWEVCFGLEGDVPQCLICFIAFVFIFLGLGFWAWHIGAIGVIVLGLALFCAVR